MTDKGDVVGKVDEWASCYDLSYRGIIVPEAFGHPAKMSRGLLTRILRHAKEEGWLKANDICLDVFAGVGTTLLLGAYEGYRCIGIELEKTFVDLTTKNIALHARKLAALGCPQPVIIQGDSRRLCEILQEADLIVSSPPFMENNVNIGAVGNTLAQRQQIHDSKPRKDSYGTTPGQLGAMKPGSIDCVLSSPPYAETLKGDGTQAETAAESYAKRTDAQAGGPLGQSQRTQGYGSKGNLGNLKPGDVNLILSSPPYEGIVSTEKCGIDFSKTKRDGDTRHQSLKSGQGKVPFEYGETEGQLGNSRGPTFWDASFQILQQCYAILRPGGVAIWVVKDFVRAKKRVDFTGDWRKLCEAAGFTTLHEHHAMLYKEHRFRSIWGEEIIRRTNRASFFRTLANNKAGWAAYWEIVPETERQEWLITAKEQLPPGKRQHIILGKAQELAFKDTAERIETWNEHVRIDFEVVLCMRKPE